MRKVIVLALFCLLAMQAPAFAEGLKIGVVNLKSVVEKSEPGMAVQKTLQAKFEKMKADIEKQKTDIEKMRDDMQKQSMAMTPEARQDKEMAFKRRVRDYQDTVMAYQRRMKSDEQEATTPVLEMLSDVVKDYAKRNKFTVILDAAGPLNNVLYYDDSVDVTNDIISALNTAWKNKK